jgi:hypothetical protein
MSAYAAPLVMAIGLAILIGFCEREASKARRSAADRRKAERNARELYRGGWWKL